MVQCLCGEWVEEADAGRNLRGEPLCEKCLEPYWAEWNHEDAEEYNDEGD